MINATEHRTCPSCGVAIPANAPQGICPKCLMAAAAVATDAGPSGGKRPEPPSLERLAAAFPQLEVIEFIGQGGMGAVYKARQKQLDRIVALKVLPPGIGGDPSFAERFTREAKALAKLLHPNIVALFEFGQADGIYYLLMEYVDGVSLGQLLRSSRVSPREALAIVPQICDALQFAHDQGIVHRDIKPENILLDRRGRVKVADFGLAKLVEMNAPLSPSLSPSDGERVAARQGEGKTPVLTDAGKIMGTPAYMAPEQVEHPADVDHRADIYALGVVFYQMLTGELPGKRLEPPSSKVQIDVRLDEVVLRALEKKPGLRYQQVREVKTLVETIASTSDESGVPLVGLGVASTSIATAESFVPPRFKKAFAGGLLTIAGYLFIRGLPELALLISAVATAFSSWMGAVVVGLLAGLWCVLSLVGWRAMHALLVTMRVPQPTLGPTGSKDRLVRFACLTLYAVVNLRLCVLLLPIAGTSLGSLEMLWESGFAGKAIFLGLLAAILVGLRYSRPEEAQTPNSEISLRLRWLWIKAGFLFFAAACLFTAALIAAKEHQVISFFLSALGAIGFCVAGYRHTRAAQARAAVPRFIPQFMMSRLGLVALGLFVLAIPIALLWPAYFRAGTRHEVHYRVFEVESAVADKLVPVAQRQNGATGNWQVSEISPEILAALLDGRVLNKHVMMDRHLLVPTSKSSSTTVIAKKPSAKEEQRQVVGGWPIVSDFWSHSLANHVLEDIVNVSGHGFFGVRRKDGVLQLKIERVVTHKIGDRPAVDVNIAYEGNAPQSGALAFFIPFARRDDTTGYFLLTVEVIAATRQFNSNEVLFQFSHPEQRTGGHKLSFLFKDGSDTGWRPMTGQELTLNGGQSVWFRARVDATMPGSLVAQVATSRDQKTWETNRVVLGPQDSSMSLDFSNSLHVSVNLLAGQSDATTPRPVATEAASTANLTFGPVMERIVNEMESGHGSEALCIRTGKFLSPPKSLGNQWVATNSIDLMVNYSDDTCELVVNNMTFGDLGNNEWEAVALKRMETALAAGPNRLEPTKQKGNWTAFRWRGGEPLPATFAFRTASGDKGLLQIAAFTENPRGVKLRYKLVQQNDAAQGQPISSPELLAEPPKLQFIAWQDEWKTNQPGAARHPDGSVVTEAQELGWLRHVHPGFCDVSSLKLVPDPRFLHLWFSQPGFSQTGLNDVSLLDDAGKPIKLGGEGSIAGGAKDADEQSGNRGWLTYTLSPSEGTNLPSHVTVQLRYTTGPLERTQEVTPNHNGMMSLEGGSQLNGVGQNSQGRAFVAIAVDAKNMQSRQFDVAAIAKDGREILHAGWGRGGPVGGGVRVENFDFEIPLADVAKFIIGTRPIRTMEWKDVVLPAASN